MSVLHGDLDFPSGIREEQPGVCGVISHGALRMLDADLRRAARADFAKEIRGIHGRQFRLALHIGRTVTSSFGAVAFGPVLEIAMAIFGAGSGILRWLPSRAIERLMPAIAAGLARALMSRSLPVVVMLSAIVALAAVRKAFAISATMMETMMLGTLAVETFTAGAVMVEAVVMGTLTTRAFAAKAVMPEAVMATTLAVEAFAARAVMAEAMMVGTLTTSAFAAKAVMPEAVMATTLAVEAFAAGAVMAEAVVLGALMTGAFAAKAVMAEAFMPRFFAAEAVMMLEPFSREALLVGTVVFTAMPGNGRMLGWRAPGGRAVVFAALSGNALMIVNLRSGTLRFVTLRWGGVVLASRPGACLGDARMAGALLGAIGVMGRVRGGSENVFADFHGDLLFFRLADDGERRGAVLAGRMDEDLKLPGINDLLIVIELQHIETLEAGRGCRAIWQNGFHHQTEVFGQAKLRSEDGRHRGGDHANEGHWLWRRERRVLEVAGAFGAAGSAFVSLRPLVEFPMFSGTLWVLAVFGPLAVSGVFSVLARGAVRTMPPDPMSVTRRMLLGALRRRCGARRCRRFCRRFCGSRCSRRRGVRRG